jgi:hypothetical protein
LTPKQFSVIVKPTLVFQAFYPKGVTLLWITGRSGFLNEAELPKSMPETARLSVLEKENGCIAEE